MDDIQDVIARDTPMPPWPSIPSSATSAYSNITANDNSRIHNGHNFYFHQYYTVQSDQDDFVGSSFQANLKRKRSLADIQANPRTRKAQETLDDVLKKLGKLALSIQHRKEGNAAEKIARRVAAIFDAITTHGDDGTWDKTAARQLGKLGATVKWEEQFDINSVPQRGLIDRMARAKTRRIFVQISDWNISLTTTTLDAQGDGGLREVDCFSTLRAEPQHRFSGPALAVFFSEYRNCRSTITIPPTVLAYNTVSNDAEVFQLLQSDDLDGLLRLLASGEATIRDCDESGRSLLHYTCEYDSIKCCSFLVGRGVDIDRIEVSFENADEGRKYASPMQTSLEWDRPYLDVSCFDILWRAGADPSITADSSRLPPLLDILNPPWYPNFYDPSMFAYFEEGSPCVDFKERFEHNEGRGYWLELCLSEMILYDPSILQAFAEKGADITEVDKYGFNCLFVFMSRVEEPDTAQEYKALQCLLETFNDIYALEATGNDIFAYVNELRDWPKEYTNAKRNRNGSYMQDLWYCALARSKLDIRHNVQPCNRLARYTMWYTPIHYSALCHLEDWDSFGKEKDLETQIRSVLQEYPLSEH